MTDTKSEASDPLMFKVLNQFRANGHLTATLPSYTVYDSTPDAGVVHLSSNGTWDEKTNNDEQTGSSDEHPLLVAGAGRLPEDVYERTLVWWRAAVRRTIVKSVAWESKVLAGMQERVRHPFLDAYFVYTSSLGTHTFFMVMLPALFFFGYAEIGRGLLLVLASGVYFSSFVKDLICSPRPFAPPVTRLTIGNHHLEYGFPSTHSTNSVSIALYLYSILQRLRNTPIAPAVVPIIEAAAVGASTAARDAASNPLEMAGGQDVEMMISQTTYRIALCVLLFYVFSIVYGRLYTAMHSFTDCIMGISLGAGIWGLHVLCGPWLDAWITHSGWIVPAVIIPLCLLLVHRHPQPVDDCPCFEDAIAFVSVVLGALLARWYMLHTGYDEAFFVHVMPGSSWSTWADVSEWFIIAAIKMVLGILMIFMWRLFAKSMFHFILPPTFRLLSHLFTLPHRRFYTPATDYTTMPPEKGLRPIPSVIDLPGMVEYEIDRVGAASTARGLRNPGITGRDIKLRNGRGRADLGKGTRSEKGAPADLWLEHGTKNEEVKHYDADVLTKVFVYCGIAVLATGVIPVMFEVLGWGVQMS